MKVHKRNKQSIITEGWKKNEIGEFRGAITVETAVEESERCNIAADSEPLRTIRGEKQQT